MHLLIDLIWLILPIVGLSRAIYLLNVSKRIRDAVQDDPREDVIRTQASNTFQARMRVGLYVSLLISCAIAPLLQDFLPTQPRIFSRNAFMQIAIVFIMFSGESAAKLHRFLTEFHRPDAIEEAKRTIQ